MRSDKWSWMMQWCRGRMLPPANSEVWKLAENAYNKWLDAEKALKEKANG